MSIEQLTVIVLGASLLLMAGVNIFALMKLMPLIDSEDKGINEIKALSEQTHSLLSRLVVKLEAQASDDGSAPWLEQFEAPFQGISADAIDGISESMESAEALLGDLESINEGEWNAWRDANQLQIRNLMKTQETQRRRLATLRMELDQARGTILNLRSGASRGALSAMQVSAMQAKNVNIEAELWTLKAERTRMQKELKDAQKELQALQAKTGGDASATAGDDALLEKCQALETRVAELTASNATLQATFERTTLEKSFIEDAFVRMDKQLGIGSGSADSDDDEVQAL